MKRIVLLFGGWLTCIAGFSQTFDVIESVDNINAIKRDSLYIYAESTRMDPVEAQSDAKAILELKVSEWVRNYYPAEDVDSCVARAKDNWADIYSLRGKYSRVLAYVKKSEVVPLAEEKPITEEQPQVIEPARPELSQEEKELAEIMEFSSIEPYIKNLKSEGHVSAYGKYASLPQDALCYIFVYNREGNVVAALRQSDDNQYLNLRTLLSDDVRNYKNCGAIWFQLK